MLRNYFKTAWRNLIKRKFYAFINILGLSLSITCALFLYLFITFHFSFDTYHKNAATTYKIVNEIHFEKPVYVKGASMGMYSSLASGNSNIKNTGVMLSRYSLTISTKNKNDVVNRFKEDKNIALVSDNWFRMFDYKFLRGDDNQLKFPNTAVITKTEAIKYFGNDDPIGKPLYFPNDVPVKIVGIVSDEPYNSDIKSGIYVSFSSLKNINPKIEDNFLTDWAWISDNTSVFLTLNNKQPKALIENK
jgi:putative ABC transport system permease protein